MSDISLQETRGKLQAASTLPKAKFLMVLQNSSIYAQQVWYGGPVAVPQTDSVRSNLCEMYVELLQDVKIASLVIKK